MKPSEYNEEYANVWSYGIILYEMFQSKPLELNINNAIILQQVINIKKLKF